MVALQAIEQLRWETVLLGRRSMRTLNKGCGGVKEGALYEETGAQVRDGKRVGWRASDISLACAIEPSGTGSPNSRSAGPNFRSACRMYVILVDYSLISVRTPGRKRP